MQEYLTPADAARILGVAPATVRGMANRGVLPVASRTPQGNRLFRRRDVEALAARRVTSRRISGGTGHAASPQS